MDIKNIIIIILLFLLYHFSVKKKDEQNEKVSFNKHNEHNTLLEKKQENKQNEPPGKDLYHENIKKGEVGEQKVRNILKDLPCEDYIVVNNLLIKNGISTLQIDHVVISVYGIFVIETKNIDGWVFGKEKDNFWTKQLPYSSYSISNPIKQNNEHLVLLKKYLKPFGKLNYISIIAFSKNSELKKSVIYNKEGIHVVYYDDLIQTILEHKDKYIDKDLVQIIAKWLEFFNIDSEENRKKHIAEIEKNIMRYNIKIEYGICPRCGKELKNKKGPYGPYLRCSAYPECNFTTSLKDTKKSNYN